MEFLKECRKISLLYGSINFKDMEKQTEIRENHCEYVTAYTLPDGLKITNIAKKYDKYGAYEWVTYFENTGDADTQVITELYDCDADFAFEQDKRPESRAIVPDSSAAKIFSPKGSAWTNDEFCCNPEEVAPGGQKPYYIFPDDIKEYSTDGGRSSQSKAPFFDINRQDKGVIFAIGWTGQWKCSISRNDTHINVKTKIEDTCFKLYPGEKIRTSSIVIMPYGNGQINAHNKWRRLVREHFSLTGREGRAQEGPFCHGFWGATSSDKLIDRINKIGSGRFGYEYAWIDAGWYGNSILPCPNEFEGDWGKHTGNWAINTTYHPDKLQDVVSAIKRNNMKFVLWFEPERVVKGTPITAEHPEYFLQVSDLNNNNMLLDLGNEEAWEYCYKLLCGKIEELHIDCYRQDFNTNPLKWWRENDTEDRRGMHEIKHITGMYRLWDRLLERFPRLMIDNCSSGGRRIDIETLRRSIPLWRSDYYCNSNFDTEATQTHTLGINMWLPYSGTGTGKVVNDTYRARSSYAAAMVSNYWYAEAEYFEMYSPDTMDWIRKTNMEYLKVREYFPCDFYPLTEITVDMGSWCAYQFDRPEKDDGIVMIFKRPKSKCITCRFELGGISKDKTYTFTDADTEKSFNITGEELGRCGFYETINEQRAAKLYFYKAR